MGPHALGIGARKVGTTTVRAVLRRQPYVAAPDLKEIDDLSKGCARGERWYRDRSRDRSREPRNGTISADISPSYLRPIENRAEPDRLPRLAAEDREHLTQVSAVHDAALERLLGRSLPW